MSHFPRGTGLLVIEVRCSNPNGDPDAESDPRTLDVDGRGLISPVSFKRKLRDLLVGHDGPVWQAAADTFKINGSRFRILEERGRKREEISAMDARAFQDAFWDARVFGNTFLEKMKGDQSNEGAKSKGSKADRSNGKDHFIRTGVVQIMPGVSVAPIDIDRLTMTNKAGVEDDKDRGMAPLAFRVVRHAVYAMPFFVNPMAASKSGCSALDIDLLKFLVPHAYRNTASAIRPFVEVRHAWYAEHGSSLGSCPDSLIIDALTPRKKANPDQPSRSIEDYEIPVELPADVRRRLASFEDLCTKSWT